MSEQTLNTLTPEEFGKKTFQVKLYTAENGTTQKAIFIGNELLDWQIDISSYMEAAKMGPQYIREAQRSIEQHFTESVSDFLGRKVSMLEIKEAIKTGWI